MGMKGKGKGKKRRRRKEEKSIIRKERQGRNMLVQG